MRDFSRIEKRGEPPMLFRVLGPLEVEVGAAVVVPPGVRPRALLTALLLRPNTIVPVPRLAEAVWGDELPDKADNNALHQVVARLRKALGPAGKAIVTRPPGYMLIAGDTAIDAARFEAEYLAARALASDDPPSAARLLDEALALWRGPAYGEFAEGFARAAATRLEQLRLAALEDRAALLLTCGSPAAAAAAAADLVAQEPLRERPVEVLMRALYTAGRAGEALEAYRRHQEVVAELGLESGPGLRDLQSRILRNELGAPEPAVAAGPRAPARPARRQRRELPWRPSAIVGRDRELRQLAEAVSTRRLVTLVGPGGVGKTRLALEVAHRQVEQGRSAWWADLTTVSPDRLVDALADAAGAEIRRSTDLAGSLCVALGAHCGVLFLDNAEHLLAPLAPVVERLIAATPDLVLVATSRERLALDAECVRVVAPLPVPEAADRTNPAVWLFVDRAPGLEPESLTEDDIGVVATICRRLDGLPLAIELGAARTAVFGLHELADRLGERLDLLGDGRRTAEERHRTLRAVVDWSHELLTGDEAWLFYRLAVFPGAFSLDQVESVCADERVPRPAIAGLLARLVEQSLVQAGQGRFWLLETLRAYAAERLAAAGESRRLLDRHAHDTAGRLAALSRQLWTEDEPVAVAALAEHVVDLYAAWEHAASTDRSLAVALVADVYDYAYVRQRLDLLAWGVRAASWDVDHPGLPRALAAATAAAWAAGRVDEAEEYATRAVAVAGKDHPSAARAVSQSGNLALFRARFDDAVVRFRTAAELHRAAGEHTRALVDDVSVAQALTYAGRSAEARRSMAELVVRAEQNANPSALSWTCYVAGEVIAETDVEGALAAYSAAIELGDKADSWMVVMLARSSSVALAASSGVPAAALEQFRQILEQWERRGNELAEWWVLRYLVVLLDRLDAARDAAVLAGALSTGDRHPSFGPFETAIAHVGDRLGATETEKALEEGAALTHSAAVAHARRAIAALSNSGTGPDREQVGRQEHLRR